MKHSKLPWRKVTFPDGVSFIQADRNDPKHPYDIEILGDDVNPKLYPQEQKDVDIELILLMINNAERIIHFLRHPKTISPEEGMERNLLLMKMRHLIESNG